MISIKKRDQPYLALCVLLVFLGVFAYWNMGKSAASYDAQLSEGYAELTRLENELEVKTAARVNENTSVLSMVTGLDSERKDADDKIFEAFVRRVTTWTDVSGYRTARAALIADYGLSEDSTFVKIFLPRTTTQVNANTAYGCEFSNMESTVSSINAGTYSYFTKVNCRAFIDGKASRTSTFVCLYDVNVDGDLQNVRAYTLYN